MKKRQIIYLLTACLLLSSPATALASEATPDASAETAAAISEDTAERMDAEALQSEDETDADAAVTGFGTDVQETEETEGKPDANAEELPAATNSAEESEKLDTAPEAVQIQESEEPLKLYSSATTADYGRGAWKKSGSRWWFQTEDGGYLADGIYTISGKDYAFDAAGWMVTGWYKDTYDDGSCD